MNFQKGHSLRLHKSSQPENLNSIEHNNKNSTAAQSVYTPPFNDCLQQIIVWGSNSHG